MELYSILYNVILLVLVRNAISSNCYDKTTCLECVTNSSLIPGTTCRWCPLDRKCHAFGAILTNACTTSQNIKDASKCSSVNEAYGEYNPQLAYQQLLISAVAYSDDPSRCMDKIKQKHSNEELDFDVVSVVGRRCDDYVFEYKECLAIIAVSHKYKSILLSFRGSSDLKQVLEEALLSAFTDKFKLLGNVQRYFMNAFEKLYPCVKEKMQNIKEKYSGYEFWMSGHSLGGALASIASASLILDGIVSKDKMSLYTYGMPRVGDKDFALQHDKLVNNSWRIVHYLDCIPHLPACSPTALFSCTLEGGTGPYHHQKEVYYNQSDMPSDTTDYKICYANEDSSCSNSKFTVFQSLSNLIKNPGECANSHKNYFNIPVGAYCDSLFGRRRKRSERSDMYHMFTSKTCSLLEKDKYGKFVKSGHDTTIVPQKGFYFIITILSLTKQINVVEY